MENPKNSTSDRELFIKRTIDAPVELVWEVWSKPEHLSQWWGPTGFSNTITQMDFRPGGEWNLIMHGPDGTDYDNRSIFRELIPMKKIIYEHISDPHILATITFTEAGDQTEISWHMLFDSHEQFIEVVKKYKADEGLKQNFDKLSIYLKGFHK